MDTESADYAERLRTKEGAWWKRALNVQAPYHWNLRRQQLGRTLDVGCGIGRNLTVLQDDSVGVDHNTTSVELARARGFTALTSEEFLDSDLAVPASFDGMLVAHVIEHMDEPSAVALMESYLPFVRPGGRVFMICPQERGYASDPTHVRFTSDDDLVALARTVGLEPRDPISFPFPRMAGKAFTYNEFGLLSVVPR